MARPKKKGSTGSFNNLGLKPHEEEELTKILEEKELSYRQVAKALIKQWIREGGQGVLTYQRTPNIYPTKR